MQGGSIRAPKQPEVPARDHGEGGDGGGDGKEEERRQEPGLQADGCQAGRDPSASETSARYVSAGQYFIVRPHDYFSP